MRAHSAELDHRLLSAERRVHAIKIRLQTLLADQISLTSSHARSSPSLSATASSSSHDSHLSESSSSSSRASLRRRTRCRSPLKSQRLHFSPNQEEQNASSQLHCSSPLQMQSQCFDTATLSILQPQTCSPDSPILHPLQASSSQDVRASTNSLVPHHGVQGCSTLHDARSNTETSFSPLTPPLPPPPPAPPLPPPRPPPASKSPIQNASPQRCIPPAPPSPPDMKASRDQNLASLAALQSRSQPPPPPPPPPSNLVQRISSNRRVPPPPPSATISTKTVEEEEPSCSASPQSRIEKKLDALHAALTTALSLLQSQPAAVAVSGGPIHRPTPLKKEPPPEHAVKVFDARQQMLEELKKKIGKRLKAAEEGAIANY